MSQNFNLGLSFICMALNVNNSEKIFFNSFYITYKLNQDLNQNFETHFPRRYYKEYSLEIS